MGGTAGTRNGRARGSRAAAAVVTVLGLVGTTTACGGTSDDGTPYLHHGGRATPKVG
ncbi:hypothetical protein ABT097_08240 [Streptomyces sp. NPDC002225]|uniref:hypothetical protein n=1 Tax=Streptomyces sp. NPDC002225 TaxID=3154413 RepID=UPI003324C134